MTLPGICRAVLQIYFILSFSNLSQLCFITFQSSLLPASEHHLHHHTLVPSPWPSWLSLLHPNCLKSPDGSSSIISGALSGLLGFCPSQISFPTHGFSIAQIHSQQILLWVPCLPFLEPCQIHLRKLLSSSSGNLCQALFTARRNSYSSYIS